MTFHDYIYLAIKDNRNVVITMINVKATKWIKRFLKNILCIFVDMGCMDAYETDFEADMLEDTAAYYRRKATSWNEEGLYDNMFKAKECLKTEEERVGHYLHCSSEVKLLEIVQHMNC